jgi:hypothetical protein
MAAAPSEQQEPGPEQPWVGVTSLQSSLKAMLSKKAVASMTRPSRNLRVSLIGRMTPHSRELYAKILWNTTSCGGESSIRQHLVEYKQFRCKSFLWKPPGMLLHV